MDAHHQLIVENLRYSREKRLLFTDLSFELRRGSLLLVQGENGAGKSSLLRLLTGLATPDTGTIHWCGAAIHREPAYFKQHLHYVGHTHGLKPCLRVRESLQLVTHLTKTRSENLSELLEDIKLNEHADAYIHTLSAGQRRRLALARLWMIPKPLWIIDEPLTALDTDMQTYFLNQLRLHLAQGGLAVISSHHELSALSSSTQRLRLFSSC